MKKLILLSFLVLLPLTACTTNSQGTGPILRTGTNPATESRPAWGTETYPATELRPTDDLRLGIDTGLFTGLPCKPPCWQNLTPGISTSEDVDRFLHNLSLDEWPERNLIDSGHNSESIRLIDKTDTVVIFLLLENGKLMFIDSYHRIDIRLIQIVDHFGPPEYVRAELAFTPDSKIYIFEVFYPTMGLAFDIDPDQEKDVGYIRESMSITGIHYSSPGDLLSYFLNSYSGIGFSQEDTLKSAQIDMQYTQPWPGFGEVKVMTSGR
jgi:hypothetical protein